jgi:hypothetical protein
VSWCVELATDGNYTNLLFERLWLPVMQQLLPLSLMPDACVLGVGTVLVVVHTLLVCCCGAMPWGRGVLLCCGRGALVGK